MSSSIVEAIENVSGPEFDRAVGLIVDHPMAAPTDPEIAATFARHDFQAAFRRVTMGLAKRWRCDFASCEDAVQDALLELFQGHRHLFSTAPDGWMKLLYRVAYRHLIKNRKDTGRTGSLERIWEDGGDQALGGARHLLAPALANVDEDARYLPAPPAGASWGRMQMVGAAQRFRDANGRPPTVEECRQRWRELGLPSLAQISREFKGFNDFLLEAGMTPRFTARRRVRTAVQAAKACVSWRWQHGCWPGRADIERTDNDLPGKKTCERYFGGCRGIDIQLGVEAILTPEEIVNQW